MRSWIFFSFFFLARRGALLVWKLSFSQVHKIRITLWILIGTNGFTRGIKKWKGRNYLSDCSAGCLPIYYKLNLHSTFTDEDVCSFTEHYHPTLQTAAIIVNQKLPEIGRREKNQPYKLLFSISHSLPFDERDFLVSWQHRNLSGHHVSSQTQNN